jgi:hypothetical protein
MKALTICQPYASLICLPEADPRHKRIENRTWPTSYRGPLLIHAGKSRDWLDIDDMDDDLTGVDLEYDLPLHEMAFGAVVATAKLLNCVTLESIMLGRYDDIYPWAKDHMHAEGPWCWILGEVVALPEPIPARGAQGLWDFDWTPYNAAAEDKL